MLDPSTLSAGTGARLRPPLPRSRPSRHRRPPHAAGAPGGGDRGRPGLLHRPRDRPEPSGSAGRRPRPPARRKRRARAASPSGRALRSSSGGADRYRLRPDRDGGAEEAQRASGLGRAPTGGRHAMAGRTGPDITREDLVPESVDVADTVGRAAAPPSGAVRLARRERRPSGAPPPLPRKLGISGWLWLGLIAFVFVSTALFLHFQPTIRFGDHLDSWGLKVGAHLRTPWLTHLTRGIKAACASWGLTVLGLGTIAALMVFRRWRHLLVFLGSLFLVWELGAFIYRLLTRPRPYGVRIIGGWSGFSMPSPPVGVFSAILVGMLYSLVVPGRPRNVAKWGAWAL